MPNYNDGKIYKLWIHETDDIYIGSTTQNLSQRLASHKRDFINKYNSCSSKILFELSDKVMIELIEEYKCNNKNELERKEGEHIRNNNCVNKNIAGRTQEEYILESKEKISNKNKIYYKKNKLEQQKKCNNYYNENKDAILLKRQNYYDVNKNEIIKKNSIKINCECGGFYKIGNKTNHYRTKIHLDYSTK